MRYVDFDSVRGVYHGLDEQSGDPMWKTLCKVDVGERRDPSFYPWVVDDRPKDKTLCKHCMIVLTARMGEY